MNSKFDKVIDLFMFREGSEEDNRSNQPTVTTGSIVWGVILRSAIIIFVSIFLFEKLDLYEYWWLILFLIWFLAAYPGYRQYVNFNQRMEKFEESTLCGSCKHFDSTSQLCRIFDEHVSSEHIPCGGESWEPKNFEDY